MFFFRFLQCYILEGDEDRSDGWCGASFSAVIILYGILFPIVGPLVSFLGGDQLTTAFVQQFPALMTYPDKYRYLPAILLGFALLSPFAFIVYFSENARREQVQFNSKYSEYIRAHFWRFRGLIVFGIIAIIVGTALTSRASQTIGALLAIAEILLLTHFTKKALLKMDALSG